MSSERTRPTSTRDAEYDVVVIGAGFAGLALARQLLMASDTIRILQIDKRVQVPPTAQKLGEATVQVSGYYLSKVLDLEEHLFREHYLKYNLRFHWKTAGPNASQWQSWSQSYIRNISNIATYQLNRNEIEREMLRRNRDVSDRYAFQPHALHADVELNDAGGLHRVAFTVDGERRSVTARWIVDATGRARVVQKRRGLERPSAIRHGSSFLWVEGLLDVEKLTDSTPTQIRLNPQRRHLGHLPFWLATNHFCEEGVWLWVIPLHGITSLGLCYDHRVVRPDAVNDPQRLVAWICDHFPLFARDLPQRKILHWGCYRDYAFDCARTIDRNRWAIVGEAGRFSDPLYSPGSDLIAIYNTLTVDAILTEDQADLDAKAALYEELERALYGAYVPSYAVSYDTLGDQEAYSLKYTWELTIYFAYFVFPFINDLFTDRRFVVSYLNNFRRLGRVNLALQSFINDYYHWKKTHRTAPAEPIFYDFYASGGLAAAEKTFYAVGVSVEDARAVLDEQLANAVRLARGIVGHIYAMVLDEPRAVWSRSFLESLDLERLTFDPERMRADYSVHARDMDRYAWPAGWNPEAAFVFRTPRTVPAPDVEVHSEAGAAWTITRR